MVQEWQPIPRAGHTLTFKATMAAFRAFFRTYGRIKLIGLENVPSSGGVMIAANHVSYLDPIIVGAFFDRIRPLWGLAKKELWNSRGIGWYLDQCRAIPVRRHTADRTALRAAIGKLQAGDIVLIFPEGERSLTGVLQPPETGVSLIVQKAGAPVVPLAIIGTREMLPPGRSSLRRSRITLVFGESLRFCAEDSREEIAGRIMAAVAALLRRHGAAHMAGDEPAAPAVPVPTSNSPESDT